MSDDLKVDWGPEISIRGRPSWLVDGEDVLCFTSVWHPKPVIPSHIDWHCVRKIKLRTDHPSYRGDYGQPAHSDDIAKRMEALVRSVASETSFAAWMGHAAEARAIVALLPEPVDADREEAKRIAAEWYSEEAPHIDPLTAAIRRLRALERDSREG